VRLARERPETRPGAREAGLTEEDLARIHTPIGLNLNAQTPEEIVLSIMAEIIAQRNGAIT
jgi:xanthine dehydrogenase accessory factor